jgi:hypothetical protein
VEKLIHTFEGETCPDAWLKAAEFLAKAKGKPAYNVVMGVEHPDRITSAGRTICEQVDSFLQEHGRAPLSTIAGTIFPGGLYWHSGAKGVFEEYKKIYPLISDGWGTYAFRTQNKSVGSSKKTKASNNGQAPDPINPLEKVIEKIKKHATTTHLKAIYELSLVRGEDYFEISTYEGDTDHTLTLKHPCLSHLSFKLTRDHKVMLTALYRSQFIVEKALGNLMGLGQLLWFVAAETGMEVGPLVCHSTYAKLDLESWKEAEVTKLFNGFPRVTDTKVAV